MRLKLGNPAGVLQPLGAYSHSVEVSPGATLLFLSGQVPLAPDGSLPGTLADQADQVYANIAAILAANNLRTSAIIKLTTFLVGDDADDVVREARRKYLGDHKPASTVVWVSRLVDPAWKIEVEAIVLADAS